MQSQDILRDGLEERFGLRKLRVEWVRRQTAFSIDVLVGPICRTDICALTEGTLPWNILDAHSVQLNTKVLVQVEDVINIAHTDPRSSDMPRVLQFTLTDGNLDFVAVELEPLGGRLSMRTVPGSKLVLLPTALVRRGRVLLTAKDFTFLGGPSTNIWGTSYNDKIAEALRAANLRNPNASSFDSIAPAGGSTGSGGAAAALTSRLPDMGGIANVVPSPDEQEDDDEFWAHAAVLADQTTAQANLSMGNAASLTPAGTIPAETAPAEGTPAVAFVAGPVRNVPRDTSQRVQTIRPPQPPPQPSPEIEVIELTSQPPENNAHPATLFDNEFEDGSGQRIVIPDMPLCATEDIEATEAKDVEMVEVPEIVNVEESQMDDFEVPELPLCRLAEVEETRNDGLEVSLYRAFVIRTKKKMKVKVTENQLTVSAPLDDGSSVAALALTQPFVKRLTGFDCNSREFIEAMERRANDDRVGEDFANMIRRSIRGLHGFVHLRHEEEHSFIANVTSEPPGGMVSSPLSVTVGCLSYVHNYLLTSPDPSCYLVLCRACSPPSSQHMQTM